MAARWVTDRLKYFSKYDPEIPASLHDRARDNWRPLLTIAELVNDEWIACAREAAVAIEASNEDGDPAVQLLAGCKRAFEDFRADTLSAARIIKHVLEHGEEPWIEGQLTEKMFANHAHSELTH